MRLQSSQVLLSLTSPNHHFCVHARMLSARVPCISLPVRTPSIERWGAITNALGYIRALVSNRQLRADDLRQVFLCILYASWCVHYRYWQVWFADHIV